jgi:hypothetical protein
LVTRNSFGKLLLAAAGELSCGPEQQVLKKGWATACELSCGPEQQVLQIELGNSWGVH